MKKKSLIFFGTENFAATILEGLVKNPDFEIKLVITQPDRPVGRQQKIQKPPVKILAEKYGLKIEQPNTLKNFDLPTDADLGVAVQYGLLIPKHILEAPRHGILNIHPSLLPKYRGASPIQSAILNNDTQTGVTIMKMDEGLDTGPIILQKTAQIELNQIIYPALAQKLAQIASDALLEAIPRYISGQTQPRSQDNAQATYCREFKREDGQIDWRRTAAEIYNQWRALQPWPGVFTEVILSKKKKKIKILKMRSPVSFSPCPLPNGRQVPAGRRTRESSPINWMPDQVGHDNANKPFIKLDKKSLGAMAGDGKILLIDELQPEGKRAMTAEEFINGYWR